ncbi:hypothetical protein ACIO3O_42700 [Streptomyces sp. NPDC087440]|uniref:hypothetical protein n=1 Tax=Streptomyces sp. NPDC087440 TaxID=3365790 RepID=UPI00380A5D21
MTSVMGLLEEREAAARVRMEEVRAEAERILAELASAEAVLERRVIARMELAEALAAPADAPVAPAAVAGTEPTARRKTPVAGSVVAHWHPGALVDTLAVDYRRIVELVQSDVVGSEGISAGEIADRLGLEMVPAKIEGVRSKARRLAERGWLTRAATGRFMPRQSTATAVPAASRPGGPGGGS